MHRTNIIRSTFYFILFLAVHSSAICQGTQPAISIASPKTDSLKQKLTEAKADSSRIKLLYLLGFNYEVINADSSMKYTRAGLALARETGNRLAEAGLMTNLASVLRQQGKLAESLDLLFKTIKIAEGNNLFAEVGRANRRLADVYFDMDNMPRSVEYLLEALKIDETNHIESGANVDRMSLGYTYIKVDKLDSATYYTDLAFQRRDILHNWMQYIYQAYGNIQLKKQHYDSAAIFLQKGLTVSQQNTDIKTASDICADLATLFMLTNRKDSAIYYASRGFDYGQQVSSKKGIIRSGELLAQLYDSLEPVTALKYYKIISAAKDSLFGTANVQTIQNLVSREEGRQKELETAQENFRTRLKLYGLLAGLAAVLIIAIFLFRNNRNKQRANVVLQQQKEKIELTLNQLESTQAQLIQSEKMASLGELTAGIAHEIQNPLNFVNNFSEVNQELAEELAGELANGHHDADSYQKALELANDIKDNSGKINQHGKRADAIVKGMLQHSQRSSSSKEPTDINALAAEYLRLAYNGVQSKDKSFHVAMKTEYDATLSTQGQSTGGKINLIPQDIGKVLLNLYNNAFYAMAEKKKQQAEGYEASILVITRKIDNKVTITIEDNGTGIQQKVFDKIFQPFFTTKPTGQGTGLGLSLAYDIVKAHGGEIKMESKEGEFSKFSIILPA